MQRTVGRVGTVGTAIGIGLITGTLLGLAVAGPARAESTSTISADDAAQAITYRAGSGQFNDPFAEVYTTGTGTDLVRTYSVTAYSPITPGAGCSWPRPADPRTVVCLLNGGHDDDDPGLALYLGDRVDAVDRLSAEVRARGFLGHIEVHGGAGNDALDGSEDFTFFGDEGDDVLRNAAVTYGGTGDDLIFGTRYGWGEAGDDRITGTGSVRFPDQLRGGPGNDTINGGSGDDAVDGEAGNDVVSGGSGDDQAAGGPGNDRIYGNSGADLLPGGAGRDTISGGAGDDRLYGNSGDDHLTGGAGEDYLSGGPGRDVVQQ